MARRALEISRRHAGPDSWEYAATQNAVAVCLAGTGRYPEAERLFLDALRGIERTLGPRHWRVDTTRARLGRLYRAWGKPDRALAIRNRADSSPSPDR
jgi:hypothetical protein